MRHGADWYKREPTAYLGGVQGMSAREHAVFSVVLDLIYQHGGSVNNDPAWFAGWISDMGAAAVRATILALVERGKLTLEDGQLSNNRANNQAKTKENLSENRAKIGKKGGISSGVSRSTINENKDLSEPIASPREEKRREEKKEEAAAASAGATFREQILSAIGVDPVSGMTGHGSTQLGTQGHMAEAARWLDLPGITEAVAVAEVARIAARRSDKPKSFSFFTDAMRSLSAALSAPKLSPAPLTPSADAETGQERILRLMQQNGINTNTEPMQ